ncbi:hypothetical protein G7Y79_00033g067960 [Physcia stellaris]|nr:hypothetical protein G7Y79_00033g067960 [Physcia stellaris]
MPDAFSTLPAPLPLMIAEEIEALPTLHHLLQASPTINAVLEHDHARIMKAILARYPAQLQQLLRLRLKLCGDDGIAEKIQTSSSIEFYQYLEKFLQDSSEISKTFTTSEAVKSLLSAANNIQQLTRHILDVHISRINSIKPSYQTDPNYTYRLCKGLPECRTYEPIRYTSSSWVEEQRISRALWHLQLYVDIVSMREAGRVSNTVDDITLVLRRDGPQRVWNKLAKWELEEIDCVHDYLVEMSKTTKPCSSDSPYLVSMPVITHLPVALPASYPYDDEYTRAWAQRELHLNRQNTAVGLMRIMRNQHDSPLRGCDFKPFWRLGFWIWDTKRMATLGLVAIPTFIREQNEQELKEAGLDQLPTRHSLSMDELFTRWRSVWPQGAEVPETKASV